MVLRPHKGSCGYPLGPGELNLSINPEQILHTHVGTSLQRDSLIQLQGDSAGDMGLLLLQWKVPLTVWQAVQCCGHLAHLSGVHK